MNERAVNVFVKEDRLLSLHCMYCIQTLWTTYHFIPS